MAKVSADRRLVKSAPELWAEVSDPETLARHFGEFGEIRITRTQPEKIVAWEGERASGTVEIEASGWGTRVILTADPRTEPPRPDPPPDRGTTRAPLLPRFAAPAAPRPISEPPPPSAPPPRPNSAPLPPPAATPLPPPYPSPWERRRNLLSRMFPRRHPLSVAETPPDPPLVPVPEPEPQPEPPPPSPAPTPDPAPREPEPLRPPAPTEPPEPAAVAPDTLRVLENVLDDLGAAHHRPFSRG